MKELMLYKLKLMNGKLESISTLLNLAKLMNKFNKLNNSGTREEMILKD
jgi:hypothetical protein